MTPAVGGSRSPSRSTGPPPKSGPPRAPAPGDDERNRPKRDHEHAPDLVGVDRAEFVESTGLVDEVLVPESPFGDMDFATRDRYRHAVEELARGSGRSEVEVARTAAAMASGAVG